MFPNSFKILIFLYHFIVYYLYFSIFDWIMTSFMACEQLLCDLCFSWQLLYFKSPTTFAILFTCIPRVFCFFPLCLHMPQQLRYITNRIFIRYTGAISSVYFYVAHQQFIIICFASDVFSFSSPCSSTTNISRSLTLLCSLFLLLFYMIIIYIDKRRLFFPFLPFF